MVEKQRTNDTMVTLLLPGLVPKQSKPSFYYSLKIHLKTPAASSN
jgi:hypothetical protein